MVKHTTNIKEMTSNDSMIIRSSFKKLERTRDFKTFDIFLIDKWSDIKGNIDYSVIDDEDMMKLRKNAYHNFNKAYKGKHIANSRTLRKWFGIDEHIPPKRDMMYKIALTLGFSMEETKDYMVNGLMQPTFQVNDYQEIIYMYGINNHLSYEKCSDMIQVFEANMGGEQSYVQENHTDVLLKSFEINKGLAPEDFLHWMLENKQLFKGYSKTVLDYFILLRDEIINHIKKVNEDELITLLKSIDYDEWKITNNRQGTKKDISDYIRHLKRSNSGKSYESLFDSIKRCYNIVYSEKNNADLIREMYAAANKKEDTECIEKVAGFKKDGISFMSDKYLSDILNIGSQKAEWMRLRGWLAKLESCKDDEDCPEDVYEAICEYGKIPKNKKTDECKKVLLYNIKNRNQRCRLIGREDILPLIHYIVQKRYFKMMENDPEKYDQNEAINYFISTADSILLKCGMAPISESYRSDFLMISSFSEGDMYSLNEMVEISLQV